jgi:hypothetical protein
MLKVGDRVYGRVDPVRVGTVVKVYSYGALTVKDWADVKWDRKFGPPSVDSEVTSCPVDLLEKL